MAKLNLEYTVKVDSKDAVRKLKEAHRKTEDFSKAIHELVSDLKIGISVVPVGKKKWYQFHKRDPKSINSGFWEKYKIWKE